MKSLQKLKISNSPKLDTFPEIDGDMHYLTRLTLNSTGIREVLSSIGHRRGLEYLYLSGCEDLLSLPDSLCNLMKLQCLYLNGCKKLEKLPENIGDLQDLHILDESETAISQPPPSITKLGKLWKLRFSHEQQFQHSSSFVLNQVSGLSSLTSLDLNNHNILSGLPEDLGSLHSLENLNNLNELPGELPPNLRELFADYHLTLKSSKNLVICCLKLNPFWYTDKFMGFLISYGPTRLDARLEATLVCKSDPERKYSLE